MELKRTNRMFGVKKIADALRRWFFLSASPETVRRTLHAAQLMDAPEKAVTGGVKCSHPEWVGWS